MSVNPVFAELEISAMALRLMLKKSHQACKLVGDKVVQWGLGTAGRDLPMVPKCVSENPWLDFSP